jgi:hypothetical protein
LTKGSEKEVKSRILSQEHTNCCEYGQKRIQIPLFKLISPNVAPYWYEYWTAYADQCARVRRHCERPAGPGAILAPTRASRRTYLVRFQ